MLKIWLMLSIMVKKYQNQYVSMIVNVVYKITKIVRTL